MNASQDPRSAQDQVYDYVKGRILSLAAKPGEWLKAQDIASEVGVSRTPVREALGRLEQEGFVRRDAGWGYVVRAVSFREARDLYKVREALEGEAAREAAGRAREEDLRLLQGLLDRAEQARSRRRPADFRRAARAFRAAIARLAGNALLERMLGELEDRVQHFGAMVFEKHPGRMDEMVEENRAILAALAAGDAAAAEAAARGHVQRAWENYRLHVVEGA